MSQDTLLAGRTTQCPQCGASIEITPDAIIFVCQYCGWAGSPDGLEAKGYSMLPPLPRTQIEEKATQFLKSKLHESFVQSSITEAKYIAIPFWRIMVWAHTRFNGYATRTKTQTYYVGKQAMTRSYTVYVPTQGEWTDQIEFKTVARKNAVFFGLDEITAMIGRSEAVPLDPKVLIAQKMQVLDIEISVEEADDSARNHAEDQHLHRAQSQTSKLYDCHTDTRIASGSLTLYPVYNLGYEFEGRTYRMALDGATGEVVKAELPMTRGLRLTYAAVGYIALGAFTLAAFILSLSAQTQSIAPFAAVGSILAAIPLYFATASQRTKRKKA